MKGRLVVLDSGLDDDPVLQVQNRCRPKNPLDHWPSGGMTNQHQELSIVVEHTSDHTTVVELIESCHVVPLNLRDIEAIESLRPSRAFLGCQYVGRYRSEERRVGEGGG